MLNAKQVRCITLMATGEMTQKEIAETLEINEHTISNWKKDAEFVDAYNDALKESMRYVASEAFRTQRKLLNANSEMVRYLVAKDILDRAGFKPADDVNVNVDALESEKSKLAEIIAQLNCGDVDG